MPSPAASKTPSLRVAAPVKAPRSCPNNSDSMRVSDRPGVFTARKGWVLRGLARWMPRATSSFPVPEGPWISTGTSVGAMRLTVRSTDMMAALSPTSPVSCPTRANW